MPVLPNSRHEKFAQALAQGKTADEAYVEAGFKANRGNAATLKAKQNISDRTAEIKERMAERVIERVAVTVQSLTDELEEARALALAEKQSSAAVSAVMGKAKLHGLLIDKRRLEGPNGGPVQIDLNGYSLEQLKSFQELFSQLATSSGSDPEAGESGDSEA
jgi:hypothetical protein